MPVESTTTSSPRRKLGAPARIGLKVLLVVLIGLAAHAYWAFVQFRITTVESDVAYHTSVIPPEKIGEFAKEREIRTVIDLRHASSATEAEQAACEAAGIRYVNIPSSQVPSQESVDAFLKVLDDPDSRPVLMHCYHGEGRAPMFGAIYRMEYLGWEPEEARKATRFFSFRGSFKPGSGKGEFVRSYVPRHAQITGE